MEPLLMSYRLLHLSRTHLVQVPGESTNHSSHAHSLLGLRQSGVSYLVRSAIMTLTILTSKTHLRLLENPLTLCFGLKLSTRPFRNG